jgi:hypothetical protein
VRDIAKVSTETLWGTGVADSEFACPVSSRRTVAEILRFGDPQKTPKMSFAITQRFMNGFESGLKYSYQNSDQQAFVRSKSSSVDCNKPHVNRSRTDRVIGEKLMRHCWPIHVAYK